MITKYLQSHTSAGDKTSMGDGARDADARLERARVRARALAMTATRWRFYGFNHA
jgi:hypothetical protein